jgi:hypothetical protein
MTHANRALDMGKNGTIPTLDSRIRTLKRVYARHPRARPTVLERQALVLIASLAARVEEAVSDRSVSHDDVSRICSSHARAEAAWTKICLSRQRERAAKVASRKGGSTEEPKSARQEIAVRMAEVMGQGASP